MSFDYASIRDFIIAHYKVTDREDQPFWKYVKHMDIPASLEDRLEIFKATGDPHVTERELFKEASWYAVLTGQGLIPQDYHPAADTMDDDDLRLGNWRSAVLNRVRNLPTHEGFILKTCASDDLKRMHGVL